MRTGSGLLTRVCPICGGRFQTWPSQNCTFCSRACANQNLSNLFRKRFAENLNAHPMVGRKLSEEWKLKISKATKGKCGWPKGKTPGPFAGKKHGELSKEKLSQKKRGVKSPPGTGKKISEALERFYDNHPEHHLEASARSREVQNRPEVKQRKSLSLKKAKRTAESRSKNSAIMKKIAKERNYIRHIWDNKDAKPNKLEQKVARLLESLGVEPVAQFEFAGFRLDYALPNIKLAIMAEGCYWHCCPIHFPLAIAQSQQRVLALDVRRNEALEKAGWRVLHIWEHEVNEPATLEHLRKEIL